MEESDEALRVIPELYFLIAKFLSGGPLKETAKTLLKELESVEVLPRRLDWEGNEHAQSYDELASQHADIPWRRLAAVCARAVQLARLRPPAAPAAPAEGGPALAARLSLLSERLVRPAPARSLYSEDHSIVRRLLWRAEGRGGAGLAGGRGGPALVSPRLLAGLQLQRRTLGHLSAVYCVVFDASGRYVVTGADDLLVKVWSATDGRLVATLRGAGAEITDACITADGALLAAGSVERLVRVWSLASAAPRAVLSAHQGTITSVHWAPPAEADVRCLASTSTDGSVAFWTCSRDGQFLSQPVQYVERMRPGACHMICAAWSAGGGFLAAGSADQHVRVYMVCGGGGGAPRRVLETAVHSDAVDSLAWAHAGLRFVSGSKDGTAAVWTLHATQWRHTLLRCAPREVGGAGGGGGEGGGAGADRRLKVTMVCWDCSDAYVLTAVSDCTVRVWCARACTELRALAGHRDEAYVLEPHPWLPGVVLSAGHDGQLLVWDAPRGELLATFHNHIAGQGDGAIFDAKWGGGTSIAATDSHGHLLLLGLGRGHPLLAELPSELFFHTDYRPLVRDALGGALDEQTETPPHLMAPPFLVDVEGAPHPPRYQRLVPGRERLAPHQLVPRGQHSRLDMMISALAGERTPPAEGAEGARGVWRGEGVRHTAGAWSLEPARAAAAPVVPPLEPARARRTELACAELNAFEQAWYRREMRRRPVMICTAAGAGAGAGGPRGARPGRRPRAAPRPAPRPAPPRAHPSDRVPPPLSPSNSESERWSEQSARSGRSTRSPRPSSQDSDSSCSYTSGKTEESSESSYSDWEAGPAGAEMAPPARAKRRPLPNKRYSPSTVTNKRAPAPSLPTAGPSHASEAQSPPGGASRAQSPPGGASRAQSPPGGASRAQSPPGGANRAQSSPGGANGEQITGATGELPELYRPGEWLCAVSPRKAPYHPQMGDQCLYFRLGHQRYFEAVSEKDIYKVNPRDKPWERTTINECELVKVVGIKYVIKPPRIACVRVAVCAPAPARARSFTVKYHDMPDVIDFLVLRQQYEAATARHWGAGDRFRCMIDDSWWTGIVVERTGAGAGAGGGAAGAAAHFLSLKVRWDNGEVERLSPWDLEPLDPDRLPPEPGGSVAVLPHELEAALYSSTPDEWPPAGDRAAACRAIAHHISQVMSLSVAEPFVAPVDLQLYPMYALVVPYPVDLATIRARFHHLFYRRLAAAQFDVRYLATNAEQFNEPHSPIVRQARLVTDLLLHIISAWPEVDVVGKYHELAAAYHSSDDEPPPARPSHKSASRRGRPAPSDWRQACGDVLREVLRSADAEPFRAPVCELAAPDYRAVVPRPLDLGSVAARLRLGRYSRAARFAADVRRVFANSRLYNTNKRSRIYSMTVRLSALFESVWARAGLDQPRREGGPRGRGGRPRRAAAGGARAAGGDEQEEEEVSVGSPSPCSSDSEPLAAAAERRRRPPPPPRPPRAPHSPRARRGGRGGRADSWDSDAPLHTQRKGKGVGKKSKSSSASAEPAPGPGPEPGPAPGPSRAPDEQYLPSTNGIASSSDEDEALSRIRSVADRDLDTRRDTRDTRRDTRDTLRDSSCSDRSLEVLEEELDSDVQLQYIDTHTQNARKRPRGRASASLSDAGSTPPRKRAPHTRTRERVTDGSSSSSSSWSGSESARRYESDRSYRPRYSSDDDAPLHIYRQRQAGEEGAGPSGSARRAHSHRNARGGVSLRARVSLRRYNEDSEEDSVACIGKRLPHHHRRDRSLLATSQRRRRHAAQSASVVSPSAEGAAGAGGEAGAGGSHQEDHNYYTAPSNNGATGSEGVSISSRGRVRKLTAKARGLLRE